jgi:tryptophan synthase alpha chain
VTGTGSATSASIEAALARFREVTSLPIVVGFGIKTPEQVKALASTADAVVVGSALVDRVKDSAEQAIALVKELARAVK